MVDWISRDALYQFRAGRYKVAVDLKDVGVATQTFGVIPSFQKNLRDALGSVTGVNVIHQMGNLATVNP